MTSEKDKKVFLVVSGNPERQEFIAKYINNHCKSAIIYEAPSSYVAQKKIQNANVNLVIVDTAEKAADNLKLIENILSESKFSNVAIIVIGHPPERVRFVDEIIIGKLYFTEEGLVEEDFDQTIVRALNFISHQAVSEFYLRYLSKGDLLIKQGEKAEFIYILKVGRLQAYNLINDEKIILGNVEIGEFVGEMAYINDEPRSAYVEALTDAELIEVPIGIVDKILFKRPTWSKALMQTLSKRLKTANQNIK
jgi:hypothetical protein